MSRKPVIYDINKLSPELSWSDNFFNFVRDREKPEKLTFCHFNDFLSCKIFGHAF